MKIKAPVNTVIVEPSTTGYLNVGSRSFLAWLRTISGPCRGSGRQGDEDGGTRP